MEVKRIHITGMHRSGTTLMKNLFYCFGGVVIPPGEFEYLALSYRWWYQSEGKTVVTKNPTEVDVGRFTTILADPINPKIICTVRDPRDILVSHHHGINETEPFVSLGSIQGLIRRVLEMRRVYQQFREQILFVRYEDLVTAPDQIQLRLAEFTGLPIETLFSNWHTLDVEVPSIEVLGMNGVRPVDVNSIGRYKVSPFYPAVLEVLQELPEDERDGFKCFLKEWNYDTTR